MTIPSLHRADKEQAGFTLIELLVYMIFAVFMITFILIFMIDFWGSIASLSNDSQTFDERLNAGDRLRTDLNAAASLIDQNSITDSHTLIPDPSDPTNTHWLLIHAVPGNIPMPASGSYTSVFYYEAPSVNSSKNFIMNGAQPYYDQFVLYLSGTTKQLMLRTIVNPGATGDVLKTSCPPAVATSSCPADAGISSDIASIDVNYYSKSGNVINYESSTDPITMQYNGPDFPVVEVVQLTLHLTRNSTIHGATNSIDQELVRVALRN